MFSLRKKTYPIFILGIIIFLTPSVIFCNALDVSYNLALLYKFGTPAPFTLIDPTAPGGIAGTINNRTFSSQQKRPKGTTVDYSFLVCKNISFILGYAFDLAKGKSNLKAGAGVTRLLLLSDYKSHQVYIGVKYSLPYTRIQPYMSFKMGVVMYPEIKTLTDKVNGIPTKFPNGKTSATYYESHAGPIIKVLLGCSVKLKEWLHVFIESGVEYADGLSGAGLVPISSSGIPALSAVNIGSTRTIILIPLKVGLSVVW